MLRPFKPADKVTLLEVFKLNTPQYFDPKESKDFLDYLDNYADTYFTIEYEGHIVGGVGYYVKESDRSGRITWIFFHPDRSGIGLGRQAVEYCLTNLKQDPKVEKLVVTTSQLAYKFFERFGYQLIRIEKNFWGPGLDLYEMEMVNT